MCRRCKVTLSGNGGKRETKTNFFGDFEFEGLADNVDYTLKIKADGYKEQSLQAKTQTDIYLGEVVLKK